MRSIANSDPGRHLLWLVVVGGFFGRLADASADRQGDVLDLEMILLIAAGTAVVGGIFWLYVLSWLGSWVGRRLGGNALPGQLRAAIAWPGIVFVATGLIWIPELVVFGQELFTSTSVSQTLYLVLWINFAVGMAALLAFIVFLVICVSEVQGFSVWKAIANVVVAAVLIVVPLRLLFWLFSTPDI